MSSVPGTTTILPSDPSAPMTSQTPTSTTSTPSTTSSPSASPSGPSTAALSTGEIAGVAVGGAVLLILVIALLGSIFYKLSKRRKAAKWYAAEHPPSPSRTPRFDPAMSSSSFPTRPPQAAKRLSRSGPQYAGVAAYPKVQSSPELEQRLSPSAIGVAVSAEEGTIYESPNSISSDHSASRLLPTPPPKNFKLAPQKFRHQRRKPSSLYTQFEEDLERQSVDGMKFPQPPQSPGYRTPAAAFANAPPAELAAEPVKQKPEPPRLQIPKSRPSYIAPPRPFAPPTPMTHGPGGKNRLELPMSRYNPQTYPQKAMPMQSYLPVDPRPKQEMQGPRCPIQAHSCKSTAAELPAVGPGPFKPVGSVPTAASLNASTSLLTASSRTVEKQTQPSHQLVDKTQRHSRTSSRIDKPVPPPPIPPPPSNYTPPPPRMSSMTRAVAPPPIKPPAPNASLLAPPHQPITPGTSRTDRSYIPSYYISSPNTFSNRLASLASPSFPPPTELQPPKTTYLNIPPPPEPPPAPSPAASSDTLPSRPTSVRTPATSGKKPPSSYKPPRPPPPTRRESGASDTSFESIDTTDTTPPEERAQPQMSVSPPQSQTNLVVPPTTPPQSDRNRSSRSRPGTGAPLTPVDETERSPISGIRYPKVPRSSNQKVPRHSISPQSSPASRQSQWSGSKTPTVSARTTPFTTPSPGSTGKGKARVDELSKLPPPPPLPLPFPWGTPPPPPPPLGATKPANNSSQRPTLPHSKSTPSLHSTTSSSGGANDLSNSSLLEKRRGPATAQNLERGLWITNPSGADKGGPGAAHTKSRSTSSSKTANGEMAMKTPVWQPRLTPKEQNENGDLIIEVDVNSPRFAPLAGHGPTGREGIRGDGLGVSGYRQTRR